MAYRKIEKCRLCGHPELALLFSVGMQSLTGVFPRERTTEIEQGPLDLTKCESCHLVQ